MKLVSFSATNYRSITSAHKIVLSDITVLIGKNNEGKTNLLRALEAGMSILQEHAESASRRMRRRPRFATHDYDWKRDFPIQFQSRKSGKNTIFKFDFLLDDAECSEFRAEIGARLNGDLQLEVVIGKDETPKIRVVKRGKGATTLSNKSGQIAQFIASRIHFNYIPAIRTEESSIDLINGMLSQELRSLEDDPNYLDALSKIAELQKPILDELAVRVQGPLKEFLPSIKSVRIEISENVRRYSLRQDVSIVIDDGTPTALEHKGDGVKSLAALGLLKSENAKKGASILAIEEPEAHLHPGAIHQVNEIIQSISKTTQVIVTTHNPLFVDRTNVKSNIIVSDGAATPAKSISLIRDVLGIKASDNLMHANYALVVEGDEDVASLRAILPTLSEKISKALKNNLMIIEPIGGAGNLSYKLSLLKNFLCATHVMLDHDEAGRTAFEKAEKDSLATTTNVTFVVCKGMTESEFEDCIDPTIYTQAVLDKFGVDLKSTKFRGNDKWSARIKNVFMDQGKTFNDALLMRVKHLVAEEVSRNSSNALHEHKRNSIDALVSALERTLKS